jgi:transposase
MITLGIDAHKRTHTVVAVDEVGRKLGEKTTTATTSEDHLALVRWAERFGVVRTWAVEDCRHLSRRLADLLRCGERIVRVPPKLMAHTRDAARTYGKSDPIDAQAVARAALRQPDLPVAQLDGPARELRLLVDHREDLVAERTRAINRERHRLSRTGNRQLNAAIHRMALTQARCHEDAIAFLKRRENMGNTPSEARRALKRRLSDVIYRTLLLDAEPAKPVCTEVAA